MEDPNLPSKEKSVIVQATSVYWVMIHAFWVGGKKSSGTKGSSKNWTQPLSQ